MPQPEQGRKAERFPHLRRTTAIPRWWSAPAAPCCRGPGFDSSRRAPWHGGATGCRPGTPRTLAASPSTPVPTPTPPPPTPPPETPPPPPSAQPSPPLSDRHGHHPHHRRLATAASDDDATTVPTPTPTPTPTMTPTPSPSPTPPPPPSSVRHHTLHAFVGRVYACVLLYIIQNNT